MSRLSLTPNHFDSLRLLAAGLVVYDHSFALCGLEEPLLRPVFGASTGHLGVLLFFFISGHLIFQSYQRRPSWLSFFRARALRLLPGLWVNLILTLVLLAPIAKLPTYWQSASTYRYLLNGLLFKCVFEIKGLFETLPVSSVNGSLWTLQYEVLCYLVLWIGLRVLTPLGSQSWRWMGLALGLITALQLALAFLPADFFPSFQLWHWGIRFGYFDTRLLSELMAAFLFGALANQPAFLSLLQKWGWMTLPMLVLGGVLHRMTGGFIAFDLLVGCSLFFIAYQSRGVRLSQWLKGRDYSYGLYIYAFPVQQVMVTGLGPKPLAVGLLGLGLTWVFAAFSWHLIERPALRLKG